MLKYLITVSEDLIVAAILTGLLSAYVERQYGKFGQKAICIGAFTGFAAALIMSVMKNSTSLIHTGLWNMRIFIASTAVLVLFLIFSAPGIFKKNLCVKKNTVCALAAVLVALLFFYKMPDVYAYPVIFKQTVSGTVLSTEFLFRFIGYTSGLILACISFFSSRYVAFKLNSNASVNLMFFALCINAAQQIAKTLQTMLNRRIIKSNHIVFTIIKFTSNHSNLFIYLSMGSVVMLALLLWLKSFNVNEPYENPAQRRRIQATWRKNRIWASVAILCCFLMLLNMTAFTSFMNREVQLSPAEGYELVGNDIYISMAQLEDGHLHRYAYTTESGIEVRFIIIKKPNSSAYGIGLDACDICGETGYYERDGQVVCKLCDVVMNINTIGFKGGCNPIPIEYSISSGNIIIPVSTLTGHEKDFR